MGQHNAAKAGNSHEQGDGKHRQKNSIDKNEQGKARVVKEDDEGFFQALLEVVSHKAADGKKPLQGKGADKDEPEYEGSQKESHHALHLEVEGNGDGSQQRQQEGDETKANAHLPTGAKIPEPVFEGDGAEIGNFHGTGAEGKAGDRNTAPAQC